MDILMGLVIAMFIITAAYVGYHVSEQQPMEKDVGGHNVTIELEIFSSNDSKSTQTLQKYDYLKSTI